jgi:alpha-L-rhamnosidase
VTVWTQAGAPLTANSWFETGLMDPSPSSAAWGGATWIGGGHDDLVLYSPYLAIFDVKYVLAIAPGSTRASLVYGANDSRLMDKFKNIYQLESGKDQSHSAGTRHLGLGELTGREGEAARLPRRLQGHRLPSQPLKTFEIDGAVINDANKHGQPIEFRSAFGRITLTIDGSTTFARHQSGAAPRRCGAPPPRAAEAEATRTQRRLEPELPWARAATTSVRHAVRHGFSVGGPARHLP